MHDSVWLRTGTNPANINRFQSHTGMCFLLVLKEYCCSTYGNHCSCLNWNWLMHFNDDFQLYYNENLSSIWLKLLLFHSEALRTTLTKCARTPIISFINIFIYLSLLNKVLLQQNFIGIKNDAFYRTSKWFF